MAALRVGVLGCGVIGRTLLEGIRSDPGMDIAWLYLRDPAKAPSWLSPDQIVTDVGQTLERPVDIVVEALVPDAARDLLPSLAAVADILPFTLTLMADPAFSDQLERVLADSGHRLFVPNGAIIGLDGIAAAAGAGLLQDVAIHTTKGPESLGLAAGTTGIVHDGSVRDACPKFQRNVNSHAALALAGLGFDRTRSIVEAVPGQRALTHRITVGGTGFDWSIDVTSQPAGKVTGAFTPASALASLKRRLPARGGISMA